MSSQKTPTPSPEAAPTSGPQTIESVLKIYGDLLFDLCESVLRSTLNSQFAFRSIVKEIKRRQSNEPFLDHQRAWVLSIACQQLREIAERRGRKMTASEQIELDSAPSADERLEKFDSFFHRLGVEDQLLLLLKDKYGIPMPEIATAMGTPEGSLKMRRQQALRVLEDWIWQTT